MAIASLIESRIAPAEPPGRRRSRSRLGPPPGGQAAATPLVGEQARRGGQSLSVEELQHVWVAQLGLADCGLAALAIVALRRGVKLSVKELCAKMPPGPQGLSLMQLQKLAADLGLPSRGVRAPMNRPGLGQVRLPAIAHLNDGHYIVLHELRDAGVVVADPAAGITTWSVELLAQCASGAMLLFDRPLQAGGQATQLLCVRADFTAFRLNHKERLE
jgi:hypothetical protein